MKIHRDMWEVITPQRKTFIDACKELVAPLICETKFELFWNEWSLTGEYYPDICEGALVLYNSDGHVWTSEFTLKQMLIFIGEMS
jgi:hypothetical protein